MSWGFNNWNSSQLFSGCYYYTKTTNHWGNQQIKQYLPLVDTRVHSTILSTTSRTLLTQTFTNPSSVDAIKECVYVFPLFDGVSVVSFKCRIGNKVLTGLVKAKEKAKAIFNQAVARGETAGLLEQAPESSDIFSTKLGNIPAGQSVIVEIQYVGELKHHETEGIRFTIPTKIAPRYGGVTSYDADQANSARDHSGIKITVDVNMPEGSFIKAMQSPSHTISVSIGTISTSANSDPMMNRASATLALGHSTLDKDFVLIVQSKDIGVPKALLETHPTIPNQRALMVTLVPKFTLPPTRPEIVFVADRSGSMQGNIPMLKSAMNVFLKSMPAGVKFNICSFGSGHSFLWPKSQSYTKETLALAMQHVQYFGADMGGTETFRAMKATIDQRYGDLPLEIILLTDGDISSQNELFAYINQKSKETDGNVRVFPLGIGNGVSHALIEGLARAGDGFAQAVQDGERLDNCVVRMLRGALSPHVKNYTLEVKYEAESDGEEEIDFVTEGMKVLLDDERSIKSEKSLRSEKPTPKPKGAISLFDTSVDPEKEDIKGLDDSKFWLPQIPIPRLLQAPHKIPSLYAFSRSTAYLLMSEESCQRKPIAVILRGVSAHGPLELEIAVEVLAHGGETIHQLAAKKAVQDLEEGRGWIYDTKDQNGILVKDRYPSRFDDLVEREAVRLGEKFQIAGKWCSFVAVAANDHEIEAKKMEQRRRSSSKHDLDPEDKAHHEDRAALDSSDEDYEVIDTPNTQSSKGGSFSRHHATSARRSRKSADLSSKPSAPMASPDGNHALSDYQMQMMLLEQQNKKRLMMARQEQDATVLPHPPPPAQISQKSAPVEHDSVLDENEGISFDCHDNDVLQDFDFDSFLSEDASVYTSLGAPAYQPSNIQNQPSQGGFYNAPVEPSTGGSIFGNVPPQRTGTNLFSGSIQQPKSGGLFGNASQQPAAGGLFGNASQQPVAGGLFGKSSAFRTSSTSTPFGASAPITPAGPSFGGAPNYNTQNTMANSSIVQAFQPSSAFGSASSVPPPPPPPRAGGGLFGSPASNPWDGRSAAPTPVPTADTSDLFRKSTPPVALSSVRQSLDAQPKITKSKEKPRGFAPPPPPPASRGPQPPGAKIALPASSVPVIAQRRLPPLHSSSARANAAAPISAPPVASGPSNMFGGIMAQPEARSSALPAAPAMFASPHQASYSFKRQIHTPIATPSSPNYNSMSIADKVLALIELQDFDGFWAAGTAGTIVEIFGWDWCDWKGESADGEAGRGGVRWITMLVIAWLEEKAASEEGVWGLVVDKAKMWLEGLPELASEGGAVALERKAKNEVRRH